MDMYNEAYRIAGDLHTASDNVDELRSVAHGMAQDCDNEWLGRIGEEFEAIRDSAERVVEDLNGFAGDLETLAGDLDYIHDNDERLSNLIQAIFDIDRGVATLDDVVDMAREASNYLPENCER
jgi:methyl-accepting chemotaxis protein